MRERLQEQINKLKNALGGIKGKVSGVAGGLSKRVKILIGVALAVLIIVIAFVVAMALNSKEYDILYTGLEEAEAIEIIGVLEAQLIEYEHKDGTIYVPKDNVDQVKVALAAEGYPKSGFTYDLFIDNVGLLATDFEKYKYAQFELESRMATTIEQFEGVEKATVTLAMEDEQKYVLEEDVKESSASVTVVMDNGGSPSKKQVAGIQRLVAKGVPGLEIENVAVIDGNGEEVTAEENENEAQEGATALKLNVEKQIEQSLQTKVLELFKPVFGEDNIRVSVSCSVDMDKKIKEIIEYIPSEDNKGVLSSAQTNYEIQGEATIEGGVPGTVTNADIPVYPGVTTDGEEIYFKDERALDYLVSQVKEQIQSDAGEITDISVSVAVDSADLTAAKAGELRQAIALAVGVDLAQADTKIAVFNAPFYTPEPEPLTGMAAVFEQYPMLRIVIPGVIALILAAIIATLAVIKRNKLKKQAAEVAAEAAQKLQEAESLVQLEDILKTREEELKGQIQDFTDINPEISAQLLKTWLRGDEDNG